MVGSMFVLPCAVSDVIINRGGLQAHRTRTPSNITGIISRSHRGWCWGVWPLVPRYRLPNFANAWLVPGCMYVRASRQDRLNATAWPIYRQTASGCGRNMRGKRGARQQQSLRCVAKGVAYGNSHLGELLPLRNDNRSVQRWPAVGRARHRFSNTMSCNTTLKSTWRMIRGRVALL